MEKLGFRRFLCHIAIGGLLVFGVAACDNHDSNTPQPKGKAIGYISSQQYKEDKIKNQLNLDLDKYAMLNYAYFGVANDGSLLSRDFANVGIPEQDQLPAGLLSPESDYPLLFGDVDLVDNTSDLENDPALQERFDAQGFVLNEDGDGWRNDRLGSKGPFPVPLKTERGSPGLIELAHQHHVPLLASIGGPWMSKHFASTIADPTKRETFLAGIKQLMDLGFDGIDIDWIYPDADSGNAFAELIVAVRDQIGDRILTAAFNPDPSQLSGMDWKRLAQSLDYFNMLTYMYEDFYGKELDMYAEEHGIDTDSHDTTSYSDNLKRYLLSVDVPLNQVNIAVPFFGWLWLAKSDFTSGDLSSNEDKMMSILPSGYPVILDEKNLITMLDYSQQEAFYRYELYPNSYGWEGSREISEADEAGVALKAEYARNNLAGIVVWHVLGDLTCDGTSHGSDQLPICDKRTTPLTDAMDTIFKGNSQSFWPNLLAQTEKLEEEWNQQNLSNNPSVDSGGDSGNNLANIPPTE